MTPSKINIKTNQTMTGKATLEQKVVKRNWMVAWVMLIVMNVLPSLTSTIIQPADAGVVVAAAGVRTTIRRTLYKFESNSSYTWQEADDHCRNNGFAGLAQVQDNDQGDSANGMNGLHRSVERCWIGGTDKDQQGVWKWTGSSTLQRHTGKIFYLEGGINVTAGGRLIFCADEPQTVLPTKRYAIVHGSIGDMRRCAFAEEPTFAFTPMCHYCMRHHCHGLDDCNNNGATSGDYVVGGCVCTCNSGFNPPRCTPPPITSPNAGVEVIPVWKADNPSNIAAVCSEAGSDYLPLSIESAAALSLANQAYTNVKNKFTVRVYPHDLRTCVLGGYGTPLSGFTWTHGRKQGTTFTGLTSIAPFDTLITPNLYNLQNRLGLRADGDFEAIYDVPHDCFLCARYVCIESDCPLPSTPTASRIAVTGYWPHCSCSYRQGNEGIYRIGSSTTLTWSAAKTQCRSEIGGERFLYIPRNEDQWTVLAYVHENSVYASSHGRQGWLGASSDAAGSTWTVDDGGGRWNGAKYHVMTGAPQFIWPFWGVWESVALRPSNFLATTNNPNPARFQGRTSAAVMNVYYCVKYRCNAVDDCNGKGTPADPSAYFPNCGACVCDEGYSGHNCSIFTSQHQGETVVFEKQCDWANSGGGVTFEAANARCLAKGMFMASIRNRAQWDGVMTAAVGDAWLGGVARQGSGVWRWTSERYLRARGGGVPHFSLERSTAYNHYIPWHDGALYSISTASDRFLRISHASTNLTIFAATGSSTTTLPCFCCARYECNVADDCSGNAFGVTGFWPNCACNCHHSFVRDCATRTLTPTHSISASLLGSLTPGGSETTSISENRTASSNPTLSRNISDSLSHNVSESTSVNATETLLATPSANISQTAPAKVTSSATLSRTQSMSESLSTNFSETLSPNQTLTEPATESASKSLTDSNTSLPTASLSLSQTNTSVPTATLSISNTSLLTTTLSRSGTDTSVPTATLSLPETNTSLPTATVPLTNSNTPRLTESEGPSATQSLRSTPTASPTLNASLTATITLSTSASHTQSASRSGTATRTIPLPVPPQPYLGPVRTLSDVGYGYRYVVHDPEPVQVLPSGIPLLFVNAYSTWHCKRFLVSAPNNGLLRFVLAGPPAPTSSSSSDGDGSTRFTISISKTTGLIDFLHFNNQPITSYIHPYGALHKVADLSLFTCGDLATSTTISSLADLDSQQQANIDSSAAITNRLIRVSAGPIALFPQCYRSIHLAGAVYSSTGFIDGPVMAYAMFGPNVSSLTIDAFRSAWLGEGGGTDGDSNATTASSSSAAVFRLIHAEADTITIGSHANPFAVPAPAQMRAMAFVSHESNDDALSQPPVVISNTTHNTVACTVGDQHAFSAVLVPSNATLNQTLPSGCFLYDTVNDLHLACQQSPACVGFTTILMQAPLKEMPLCMYSGAAASSSSSSIKDVMPYPRIFYRRPPPRTPAMCSTTVEQSGKVAVYVQQAAMASGAVVVRMNGDFVVKCGADRPFLHGFNGGDGRCKQWAMCYVGRVPVGATVSVETLTIPQQGGCDNSLGVLIQQTEIDDFQVYPTTEAPIPRLDTQGVLGREVVKHATEHTDPIRVFVFQSTVAALAIQQTGYSCALPNSQCIGEGGGKPLIGFSTPTACQACGGLQGFLNGRSGLSDRCETSQFCGQMLPLQGVERLSCEDNAQMIATRPFTGFVSVSANVALLAYQADLCTGFVAKVYADSPPSRVNTYTPTYPLATGESTFATLVGVPITGNETTEQNLKALSNVLLDVPENVIQMTTSRLFATGPAARPLSAFHVPWTTVFGIGTSLQQRLHRNSSQVCVVDHSLEKASQCTFFIPQGATRVKVSAAQTDFATKSMTVKISLDGKADAAVDVCGGPKQQFGRMLGQQDRCDVFATCTDRYLYADDTLAENNTAGIITVTLPEGMRCHGCNFIATIIAEFDHPLSKPVACPEYECPGERHCIPSDYVCDGVQDCGSGADERGCGEYVELLNEDFCRVDDAYRVVEDVGGSFSQCRVLAAAHGSTVFSLQGSDCIVMTPAIVGTIVAWPSHFVCNNSAASTFLSIERASFGLCRSSVQCHGHGAARVVDGVCTCDCNEGYIGIDCGQPLQLERITRIVVVLRHQPTRSGNHHSSVNLPKLATAVRLESKLIASMCSTAVASHTLDNAVNVECTLSSAAAATAGREADVFAHYRRLLDPLTWPTINKTLLSVDQPPLIAITARTTMTPEVAMPRCDIHKGGEAEGVGDGLGKGGSCAVTAPHDRIRVIFHSSSAILSATLGIRDDRGDVDGADSNNRINDGENSSSATNRRIANFTCERMTSYDGPAGCTVSTCSVPLSGPPGTTAVVSDIVYAPAADPLLASQCNDVMIGIAAQVSYGNADTKTFAQVLNDRVDFSAWIILGAVIFALAVVMFALTAFMFVLHWRRQKEYADELRREWAGFLNGGGNSQQIGMGVTADNAKETQIAATEEASNSNATSPAMSVLNVEANAQPSLRAASCSEQNEPSIKPNGNDAEGSDALILQDWVAMKQQLLVHLRLISPPNRSRRATISKDADVLSRTSDDDDGGADGELKRKSECIRGRYHLWGPAFAVVGGGLLVGAVVLLVFYITAFDQNSNFRVMYEEYTDDQCEQSASGYMPTRIFAVPPGSWECERMQSTGEAVGAAFATGSCHGSGGAYEVHFKTGPSEYSCRRSAKTVTPSGKCIPIQSIIPSSQRHVFVRLTCSTSEHVLSRTSILRQLTTSEDVFVKSEATDPTDRLSKILSATSSFADGSSVDLLLVPYLVGSAIGYSASTSLSVVAATAPSDGTANTDSINPLSVILQTHECTLDASASRQCAAPFEDVLVTGGHSNSTSSLSRAQAAMLQPSDRGARIGMLFNGYGTTDAMTWTSGGTGAHRYYNVIGGAFDMGLHFPHNRDDPQDDEGYAISMWLRAGPDTLGFAYAVTDAFEDISSRQVHTLDRLATIIESGSGGNAWYNTSFEVYHSLYVNGPGQSLNFAFATPKTFERVTQLDFDLREIGVGHLFNDQWHHVAVSFEVENGKVRAQLIVDGQTSYTAPGWGVCVSDFPFPLRMEPADASGEVKVHSRVRDRVTRGGLLIVGYFNGGVSNLRARTTPVLNTDFLRDGTDLMRDLNPFLKRETTILGSSLIALGSIFLAIVVWIGVRDLKRSFSSSSAGQYWHTSSRFYRHQLHLAAVRRRAGALPLRPVRLHTALRWIGLSAKDFGIVMDEIEAQCQNGNDPSVAILLLIFQIKMDNPRIKAVSAGTWNAFEDARLSDMAADAEELGGGGDLFAQLFKWSATPKDNFANIVTVGAADNDTSTTASSSHSSEWGEMEGADDVILEFDGEIDIDIPVTTVQGGNAVRDTNQNATNQQSNAASSPNGVQASVAANIAPSDVPSPSNMFSAINGMITGAVATFQGMYVWSTSISLPSVYIADFGWLSSLVSIDVAALFPGIPTLLTPLVQVAAGMLCIALVVYFLVNDNSEFEGVLARYVWRRDALEHPSLDQQLLLGSRQRQSNEEDEAMLKAPFIQSLLAPSDDAVPNSPTFVRALAVKESMRVDTLIAEHKKKDKKNKNGKGKGSKKKKSKTKKKELASREKAYAEVDNFDSNKDGEACRPPQQQEEEERHAAITAVVEPPAPARLSTTVTTPNGIQLTITFDEETKQPLYEPTSASACPIASAMGHPHGDGSGVVVAEGDRDLTNVEMKEEGGLSHNGNKEALMHDADQSNSEHQKRVLPRGGVHCVHHPTVLLTPQHQSEVWPFTNRPMCCVAIDNTLCGCDVGTIFYCGHVSDCEDDEDGDFDEEGEKKVGKERSAKDNMMKDDRLMKLADFSNQSPLDPAALVGPAHQDITTTIQDKTSPGDGEGGSLNFSTTSLGEKNKTQRSQGQRKGKRVCTFAMCETHFRPTVFQTVQIEVFKIKKAITRNGPMWLFCTALFALANAAYTPFMKTALMIVSCHPYYQCEFKDCWDNINQKFAIAATLAIVFIVAFGVGFPLLLFYLLFRRKRMMQRVSLHDAYGGAYRKQRELHPTLAGRLRRLLGFKATISDSEWQRFVSTDASALAGQYASLSPDWMYFPSLAIGFQVATLLPPLFMEPESFEQRLGCACVEVALTLLLFATNAYLSPMMMLSLRTGRVHQLLQLGLLNLFLVFQNDSDSGGGGGSDSDMGSDSPAASVVASVMIIVTAVYVFFVVAGTFSCVAWPLISTRIQIRRLNGLLVRHGFVYSPAVTLFLDPIIPPPPPTRRKASHSSSSSRNSAKGEEKEEKEKIKHMRDLTNGNPLNEGIRPPQKQRKAVQDDATLDGSHWKEDDEREEFADVDDIHNHPVVVDLRTKLEAAYEKLKNGGEQNNNINNNNNSPVVAIVPAVAAALPSASPPNNLNDTSLTSLISRGNQQRTPADDSFVHDGDEALHRGDRVTVGGSAGINLRNFVGEEIPSRIKDQSEEESHAVYQDDF